MLPLRAPQLDDGAALLDDPLASAVGQAAADAPAAEALDMSDFQEVCTAWTPREGLQRAGKGRAMHTNGDMGHVTVDVTCCSWLRHHLGDVMRHTSGSQQLPGVDGSMSVLGKHNPRI